MKYVKKEDRYSILQNVYIFLNFLIVRVIAMVLRHFQQYFSYIVAVNFIGGENWSTRSKPPTCGSQWQTLSHNVVSSTPRLSGIRTHMVIIYIFIVMIGTDCIGSCKSNYHTITTRQPLLIIFKSKTKHIIIKYYF